MSVFKGNSKKLRTIQEEFPARYLEVHSRGIRGYSQDSHGISPWQIFASCAVSVSTMFGWSPPSNTDRITFTLRQRILSVHVRHQSVWLVPSVVRHPSTARIPHHPRPRLGLTGRRGVALNQNTPRRRSNVLESASRRRVQVGERSQVRLHLTTLAYLLTSYFGSFLNVLPLMTTFSR